MALFISTLLLPLFFYVGPLRLAPFLIFVILAFVPLFFYWLFGKLGPIRKFDVLILFSCVWGAMSLVVIHGFSNAIEPLGILIAQTFGAYLIGRFAIRDLAGMKWLIIIQTIVLLGFFPFAFLESFTGVTYYLNLFSSLGATFTPSHMDPRMGLFRSQVAFEHPILFGVFCASNFALFAFLTKGIHRVVMLIVIFMLSIFSVSTGAILCIVVQFGIIAWWCIFRDKKGSWRNLVIIVLSMYITIDILSNRSPFEVFVDYLTFNSGSAYNRILIWQYGTDEVLRHPVFGIGLNEWVRAHWMSTSMDNFWLLIAVRYGIPSFLAMAVGFLLIFRQIGKRQGLDRATKNVRLGMLISFVGVFVAICSVHLWNATFCWLMFLIGSSVWIIDAPGTDMPAPKAPRRRIQ